MVVIQEELSTSVSASAEQRLAGVTTRQLGIWLAAAGWASMVLIWITGSAETFGHDQEGVPSILAIALFLVGWIVMISAMMLPSSLPTLGRVDRAGVVEGSMAAPRFMGGYFFAWAVFGGVAFAGDGILHFSVASMPWLAERPWLIAGGVAMFAGAAEILGRTPPPKFPSTSSAAGPLALGKAHALDRIRRCWPLMLLAMAIGMRSADWMVGLTLVMALELRPRAQTALRLVGLIVFSVGAAVVIEPRWMTVLLGAG